MNEGLKGLEQRMETQISIIYELQDFFKKRAEVEMQYSRDLDKLTKQIAAKHKSEKSKYDPFIFLLTFKTISRVFICSFNNKIKDVKTGTCTLYSSYGKLF